MIYGKDVPIQMLPVYLCGVAGIIFIGIVPIATSLQPLNVIGMLIIDYRIFTISVENICLLTEQSNLSVVFYINMHFRNLPLLTEYLFLSY